MFRALPSTISIIFDTEMTVSTVSPLFQPDSEHLLSFCKATADALRLDILRVLSMESFGVLELCHIFDMPQPGMSHHLKILATAQLLSARREGNSIFYRRALISNHYALEELTAALFQSVDRIQLQPAVKQRIEDIHQQRALSSKQFFEKNASRFQQNQNLIAEFSQYAGCVKDLLANQDLARANSVIEVGPGESDLINLLAERFDQICAIDNTEEMLTKSRNTLIVKHRNKVRFFLGDIASAFESGVKADLVVLNMVLHHLASPRQFYKTVSQHINQSGMLLLVDLCSHNQDWAREICGDLWLGFDPSDLDNWATESGFTKSQSAYLGLKNGFQIQIRLYTQSNNITK